MFGNKNAEGASVHGGMLEQLEGSITNNDDFKSHQAPGKSQASNIGQPVALAHGGSSSHLMMVQSQDDEAAGSQLQGEEGSKLEADKSDPQIAQKEVTAAQIK